MRSSLKNNIIVRFLKKLFRDREVITKEQKIRLKKPSLIEITKKVNEEEKRIDNLKSSIIEEIGLISNDLSELNL